MATAETPADDRVRDKSETPLVLFATMALLAALSAAGMATGPTAADTPSVWLGPSWEDASILSTVDFEDYPGSLYAINKTIGSRDAWSSGFTGQGVDVAVIDTGVAPVTGLSLDGKLINGPDLSFESQSDQLRYLDTYGHGTHIAAIIAGQDPGITSSYGQASKSIFVGVAPEARIVNMKVGSSGGAVDVSQVIAAIDWVIQHRDDPELGLNIRVLNLAYGTDSIQPYEVDPLAQVVEKAWMAGIVVVVAAGNDGNASPLRNPAYDPYVIAVGSAQHGETNVTNGSYQYDRISPFANCGVGRTIDLVAPGKSIASLRVPGSYADDSYPSARVGERLFLGSGTSQSAAIVSGAAALVLSADPRLTPDEVKYLLMDNASPIAGVPTACQGSGVVDVHFVDNRLPKVNNVWQKHPLSDGSGLLELTRGSDHITMDGIDLTGEQDIMGQPWVGFSAPYTKCWKEGKGKATTTVCQETQVTTDTLWDGGDWNGTSWSGTSWSGTSWSGTSWSGTSWSGTSWSGTSWSDKTWSGTSWSGTSWSGTSWSGTSWSNRNWTGQSWG